MQKIKKEFDVDIRQDEVILTHDFEYFYEKIKNENPNTTLYLDVKNFRLDTLYYVLERFREKLAPKGNAYKLQFYFFLNNFENILINENRTKLEIIQIIENEYLNDTYISLIIRNFGE